MTCRFGEYQSLSQVNDVFFSVLTEFLLTQNHELRYKEHWCFPSKHAGNHQAQYTESDMHSSFVKHHPIHRVSLSKIYLDDAKRLQRILCFCILRIKIVTHIHCLKGISLLCIYIKEFPSPTAMEITNCLMLKLVLMCPSVSLPASCFDGL